MKSIDFSKAFKQSQEKRADWQRQRQQQEHAKELRQRLNTVPVVTLPRIKQDKFERLSEELYCTD